MARGEIPVLQAVLNFVTRMLLPALLTATHALVNCVRVKLVASLLTFIAATFFWVVHAHLVARHKLLVSHATVATIARESLNA
jgi:hypothetical protein